MRVVLLVLLLAVSAISVGAVEPDEVLGNPKLEQRAREISKQLRCVVCLNQDIDSSDSSVARTMRIILRERLVAGDSDQEVLDYFVTRYGDFVLFRPPLKSSTYLLWFGPFVFFLLGTRIVWFSLKRHRPNGGDKKAVPRLSTEDESEIEQLLSVGEGPKY